MDGDHSVEICEYWTTKIVNACYKALRDQNVLLEGTLLKPNMCLPGAEWEGKRDSMKNAECTVRALKRSVPPAVPGITFLSGGQSEEEATNSLNAINNEKFGTLPWCATFSFGRALQKSCLAAWKGSDDNMEAAQTVLLRRAAANGDANLGKYDGSAADEASKKSLYQKGYTY